MPIRGPDWVPIDSQDTENQLEQIGHQDASLRRPLAASTPNRIFGTRRSLNSRIGKIACHFGKSVRQNPRKLLFSEDSDRIAFHRNLTTMQAANLAATSGHASNDERSADISSLDNMRIKSLRPSIIRWRMNDT
jgi:hypothetical protein